MFKQLLCVLVMLFATATAWAAVDVNKADQAALESVKGIGTKVSARILDERKKGQFKDWADLMIRVKGIKEGAATRLSKEGLTVNGASFDKADAPAKAPTKVPAKKDDKK